MKIAAVKQDVFDDLWVCPQNAPANEVIFSSMMRVGMAHLFLKLGATPIIVKEDYSPECQIWQEKTKWTPPEHYRMLKETILSNIPGQDHKSPGSKYPNGFYSTDSHLIDWNQYDIVISYDVSIPINITTRYPRTLWCYMLQEPHMRSFYGPVINGYHVRLDQELGRNIYSKPGVINFPWAFIGPYDLYELMEKTLRRPPLKFGVYPEINMCNGRPVTSSPFDSQLSEFGAIHYHEQLISDNLTKLYDSKYYVKVGGRFIRGNGIVEAISCGTLVLMNPKDVIYADLLPKETYIENIDSLVNKMKILEQDETLYHNLLDEQRKRVKKLVIDNPLQSLANILNYIRLPHDQI